MTHELDERGEPLALEAADAARYMSSLGLPTTVRQLKRARFEGRGPAYLKPAGRRAIIYLRSDLREHVAETLLLHRHRTRGPKRSGG